MATEGALLAFDRYFALYTVFKCTPLQWNRKQKLLSRNPEKLAFAHVFASWVFGWFVFVYQAIRLLKEMFHRDVIFKPHQIIMYIFYMLIVLVAILLNITFIVHRDNVIHTVNSALHWDASRRESLCPFDKKKGKPKRTFTEKVLIYLLPCTLFGSVCGALMSFASPIDPLQRFVVDHFPEIYLEYKIYVKCMAFIAVIVCGFYIWSPVVLAITILIIYTTGMQFWLTVLSGNSNTEDGKRAQASLKGQAIAKLNLYKSARIINTQFMQLCYYVCPQFSAVGAFLGIVCNFATVKMYDIIPIPGYFLMPLVSMVVYGTFSAFLPRAAVFKIESTAFLREAKSVVDDNLRKIAQGCRPIAFAVGPFFTVHEGTTLEVNRFITDFTIDLIMSVNLN